MDGVSGATYTSRAIADAAREDCRRIAVEQVVYELPEFTSPSLRFGFPEILLILLFSLSLYEVYSKIKWKKANRWSILLISFVVLGLWLTLPLFILKMNWWKWLLSDRWFYLHW